MSKPAKGSIVLIRWTDITDDNDWQSTDDPEPHVTQCESVGWVTTWTAEHVVIVRTFGGTGADRRAGDRLTFPRGNVTSWEVLRPPSGRA
jgi:hypothetical protein